MSYHPETIAIHAGQPNDPATGAVITPIYQTTTYAQSELGGDPDWCYSRTGNPTRAALEANLAAIEGGAHGLAFSSGLAAANTILQTLRTGDHVVATHDLYGGCWRLFTKVFHKLGIDFTFIDTTEPENVRQAINQRTKIVWIETPSNPLLKVTDIAACATIAKMRGVRTLVDNTFATPIAQQPLKLGADIVLHSTTKYIGGHCDVLGGALITSDTALYDELKFVHNASGAVPGPQDCFLLLRGMKTLAIRIKAHESGAKQIARYLETHPEVERVVYPGLENHPHHERAKAQAAGFGAIVSMTLRGGRKRAARFLEALRLWPLAESLGGVKSLICHPASMTHAAVEPEERERIGIGDGLLRLSVGIEHPADLIADIERALAISSRWEAQASGENGQVARSKGGPKA